MLALAPTAGGATGLAGRLRAARAPAAQLVPEGSVTIPGGATVYRYQQQAGGVAVLGGEAVIVDGTAAPPILVTDATRAGVEPPVAPTVSRARALAIARAAGDVRSLRASPQKQLVVAPAEGDRLAWRVVLPAARPLADLEVLVDARSGAVLSKRDLLQHLTGQAKLYDPNPVAEQGGSTSGLADRHDADSAILTSLREARSLPRIKRRQHCLKGKYAEALLHRSGDPVCKRSLDWRKVTRSNDRFEALMAYFHIDRTQHYIQGLGFDNVDNRRQVVLVDAIKRDQSFYSPASKRITYGSGKVDDAEDGDVIVHEYGHSIEDNQARGFGTTDQSSALGEGWGDYLSATMTYKSAGLPAGTYAQAAACIFDWDGIVWGLPGPCGRTADDPSTLQQAQQNCPLDPFYNGPEIHCLGQVWSSALLDLRGSLGGAVLDKDLISSQFMYAKSETFSDAAQALECADEALHPAGTADDCHGQNYTTIHAEMQNRGIQ